MNEERKEKTEHEEDGCSRMGIILQNKEVLQEQVGNGSICLSMLSPKANAIKDPPQNSDLHVRFKICIGDLMYLALAFWI